MFIAKRAYDPYSCWHTLYLGCAKTVTLAKEVEAVLANEDLSVLDAF